MFKKGDAVTIVNSYDCTGTVKVRHYLVSSWGKKQGTLIRKDDGSNAEFRVYTQDANSLQGIRSSRIMPTAEYSTALALRIAEEFIADEHKRARARYETNTKPDDPHYMPYAGTVEQNLAFEQRIWERHNATAWAAAVQPERHTAIIWLGQK